jgi:hypothetical protein
LQRKRFKEGEIYRFNHETLKDRVYCCTRIDKYNIRIMCLNKVSGNDYYLDSDHDVGVLELYYPVSELEKMLW